MISSFSLFPLYLSIILIILYIIFHRCQTRKKCKEHDNGIIIKTIDLNYDFMNSFINNELTIMRNSNTVTSFIDNDTITHFLKMKF